MTLLKLTSHRNELAERATIDKLDDNLRKLGAETKKLVRDLDEVAKIKMTIKHNEDISRQQFQDSLHNQK